MKRTQLPKELIEDYKSGALITNLCCKYELSKDTIRNQLIKIGVRKKGTHGGCRKGCGRKRCKEERGSEMRAIREKKCQTKRTHKRRNKGKTEI